MLVDELVVALTVPHLLPLTVGVLGDWGSGKSSLLRIARRELEAHEGQPYVCVEFSPWQYEDYDDVKSALMRTVLDACEARIADVGTAEDASGMRRFLGTLGRRSRSLGRGAAAVAPAATQILGAVDPSLADSTAVEVTQAALDAAKPLLAGETDDPGASTPVQHEIRDVQQFREAFQRLVASLEGVEAVVVFVDDLDRCLPETVVDTFEAIRLFLHAPGTAYVVAANREIVETAIDSRYPELRREDGRGIGHDYLEKMLQLQVSVPPLSAAETETYVNLLVTQLHLPSERFSALCASLGEHRSADSFASSFDLHVAGELLGAELTPAISGDIAWATAVSPALSGLRGNPRQVKRFLNDLTWRRRAAARRGVELRHDVLAKLMVLEEQSAEDFQTLFDWQLASSGPSPQLVSAETAARATEVPSVPPGPPAVRATGSPAPEPDPLDEVVAGWVSGARTRDWLRLSPDLREVNLRPYFTYFRDRLVVGSATSALRPALQALVAELMAETPATRRAALDGRFVTASPKDQDDVLVALLDALGRRPDGPALTAVIEAAGRVPRLGAAVCDALARVPHTSLPAFRIPTVLLQLRDVPGRDALGFGWAASPVKAVRAAATAAMKPKAGT